MNADQLNIALAIFILVASLPVLVLARATVRGKLARRLADFAQALDMTVLDHEGPEVRPIFEGGWLLGGGVSRMIVSVIGGTYSGREVLLIEVAERFGVSESRRGWIGRRLPRGPRGPRQLIILFVEPLPNLPEFWIGLPSTERLGRRADRRPNSAMEQDDPSWSPLANGLVLVPLEARFGLPEAFLDRSARVLVGRPHPWVIEGANQCLALRIAQWRLPSRVQSYRAILDDAMSLRESFDEAQSTSNRDDNQRSIRSALERIRETSRSTPQGEESGKLDS